MSASAPLQSGLGKGMEGGGYRMMVVVEGDLAWLWRGCSVHWLSLRGGRCREGEEGEVANAGSVWVLFAAATCVGLCAANSGRKCIVVRACNAQLPLSKRGCWRGGGTVPMSLSAPPMCEPCSRGAGWNNARISNTLTAGSGREGKGRCTVLG